MCLSKSSSGLSKARDGVAHFEAGYLRKSKSVDIYIDFEPVNRFSCGASHLQKERSARPDHDVDRCRGKHLQRGGRGPPDPMKLIDAAQYPIDSIIAAVPASSISS